MPNRVLKETIRTSKSVNAMTDFQFRIWAYLITYVDDYGRGSADPELLKGFLFPRRKRITEADIAKALADLAGMGCILLYEVDGESYLCFPKWSDHQRIQQKRSKFPEPSEKDLSRYVTVTHGDSPLVSNPIQSESNPYPNPVVMGTQPQRFSKPDVEEIAEYCRERGSKVDAQRFYDYYEANGWKVGKNPMKDWKAAIRTWERNQENRGSQTMKSGKETSFDLDEYTSMVKAYRPKYKKKEEQA